MRQLHEFRLPLWHRLLWGFPPYRLWRTYRNFRAVAMGRREALQWAISNTIAIRTKRK